jgi:hypothetical protein
MEVKRTERGWAGHFCCASNCLFRRNTLLERGEVRIVVSTVGLYKPDSAVAKILGDEPRLFKEIGWERYYETMAFHACRVANRYWDADVERQVSFAADWAIAEVDADDRANDMHEAVVDELTARLEREEIFDAERREADEPSESQ